MIDSGFKFCIMCEKLKSVKQFKPYKMSDDGRYFICNDCDYRHRKRKLKKTDTDGSWFHSDDWLFEE